MGARYRRRIAAGQAKKFDRVTRNGAARIAQRVFDLEAVIEALITVVGPEKVYEAIRTAADEVSPEAEPAAVPTTEPVP
jgi:hypothetical protein